MGNIKTLRYLIKTKYKFFKTNKQHMNNKLQNNCAQLKVNDEYSVARNAGKCTLSELMNLQKWLQEEIYNKKRDLGKFEDMTIGQIKDFLLTNKLAIDSEMMELFDSLGGINDGTASAAWKPWKSTYNETQNKTLGDLTENDRLELFFEVADIFHFIFNIAISLGITPELLYNLYMAKNVENVERQKRGY